MDESSLRENMQLEKLRALHHSDGQAGGGKHSNAAENSAPQRKPGLANVCRDPSGMGRELQDEVDERVRQGACAVVANVEKNSRAVLVDDAAKFGGVRIDVRKEGRILVTGVISNDIE